MNGLQTVAGIGERTLHDDAHRVVDERLAHLLLERAAFDAFVLQGALRHCRASSSTSTILVIIIPADHGRRDPYSHSRSAVARCASDGVAGMAITKPLRFAASGR